jgi:class 3 adenylate cyclase/pimeloyl-ACP methyl ester carboxylesterase
VAYQILGHGAPDLILIPAWDTNIEIMWEEPSLAHFLERLAAIGRLIVFDKRGTGVSDPVPLGSLPTMEQWVDDVRTVLDAVGSQHAVVFGHGEGGAMAMLFAAQHPDRTTALVLADTCARRLRAPDYPHGLPPDVAAHVVSTIVRFWGTGQAAIDGAPSRATDAAFIEWRGRYERLSMSPGEFSTMYPLTIDTDLRPVLSTIRVPTLVLHRRDNRYIRVDAGRHLADNIAGAKFVALPGDDHFFHCGDTDAMLDVVQEFVTGSPAPVTDQRVLATVLFTDIVGSTEHAATLGDRAWHALIERHHALIRRELARFRGREIDTAGDGFFATFDGPARAVRCALAMRDAVRELGIELRAGVHIGECEIMGAKVGGIAVHIGARIAAAAAAGEVLVSATIRDLVAGSQLEFDERGIHRLKGIEGEWALYAAR